VRHEVSVKRYLGSELIADSMLLSLKEGYHRKLMVFVRLVLGVAFICSLFITGPKLAAM
jgi:hypothetical protein